MLPADLSQWGRYRDNNTMTATVTSDWTALLSFGNRLFSSAIVILSFSLLVYLLAHNLRSSVARSYLVLLAGVLIVYTGDVAIPVVTDAAAAVSWLRFQWLGIAFIPAAYYHFSDALLRAFNDRSPRRHRITGLAYAVSALSCGLALFTDLLVRPDGTYIPPITQLAPGPYFSLFAIYFGAAVGFGTYNVWRARVRALTTTLRRRMTYLMISFLGPALGVFPYLIVSGAPGWLSPGDVLIVSVLGNVAIGLMLVIMTYTVTYYGALGSERIVKRSFIRFLLRGPVVATAVIVLILTVSRVEAIFGLPPDTVLVFAVVGLIVLLQLLIVITKPILDQLIHYRDRQEIVWLQEMDQRLLTSTDLSRYLESVLASTCEVLRVRTGFIAALVGDEWQVEAVIGPPETVNNALQNGAVAQLLRAEPVAQTTVTDNGNGRMRPSDDPLFHSRGGYWFCGLYDRRRETMLGLLVVAARTPEVLLTVDEREALMNFIGQAEAALEDRHLQRRIFTALEQVIPEIQMIQSQRGPARYASDVTWTVHEPSPTESPDFQRWVKDALTHYWGGPKLTRSPLLRLRVVNEALTEHDGNPVKALRAVLRQAIESQRPEGQRQMTASEWLLYNILDLKFIQGKRVRDVADRLAMSESDLYRKQRVAIAEVAKALAEMEARSPQHNADNLTTADPGE
ncbi:MAG TPA: hypothetical protein EYP04_06695 [Anaerolineae bacterium]|nr:hypothetical protein [Anaerolineae bacterium]